MPTLLVESRRVDNACQCGYPKKTRNTSSSTARNSTRSHRSGYQQGPQRRKSGTITESTGEQGHHQAYELGEGVEPVRRRCFGLSPVG